MALARVTTWSAGDVLTAAALNGEINNVLNNAIALVSPWTANMDANNKQLTNHVLEKLAAAATAATEGRTYYRTDTDLIEYDTGSAIRSVPNFVECGGRLSLSGSDLLLAPHKHNIIPINGRLELIPDAGVSLAIGAAAASTAYNIYAYMSGATMTLEFATTATAVQAGTGITIKSGDATRTFVGTDTTTSAPAWTTPVSFFNAPSGVPKIVTFTRDTTAASGSQAVTGVGFQPSAILFFHGNANGSASIGASDGTTGHAAFGNSAAASPFWTDGNGFLTSGVIGAGDGTNNQSAVLASRDADGFTLTWTKTGSPSLSTITVTALCFR